MARASALASASCVALERLLKHGSSICASCGAFPETKRSASASSATLNTARPVRRVLVASPPAAAADASSFSMNANLMFAEGHVASASRSSESDRACSASICLSLLSPVKKDMRTRKLTMISRIPGVGAKSSASGGAFTSAFAAPRSAFFKSFLKSPARVASFSAAFFRATRSPVDANSARLASHSGTKGFTAALLLVTASRATKVKSADSEGPEPFSLPKTPGASFFFSFRVSASSASPHAGASGCSAGHASIRMTTELRPTHATAPERMTSSSSFSARISRTRSTEAVTSNCGRVFRSASSQWEKAMFPASESRSSRTRPTRTAFHGLRYASIRFSSAEKEYRMDVRVGGLGTSASCARVAAASETPAAFACASLSCHSFDVMAVRSRATAYPRVEHTGQARRSRAARVTARSDARIVTLGPNVQPRFGVWDATLGCPLIRARLRAARFFIIFTRAASEN